MIPVPKPSDKDDQPPVAALNWRERSGALLIGVTGVGVGGAGIFLSENQAGTTAMLLLGALFLLMGVQGTAIRRATKDSGELERRLKPAEVAEKAKEKLEDEGPAQAEAYIEGARSLDPGLARDPGIQYVSEAAYQEQVLQAVARLLHASDVDVDTYMLHPNYRIEKFSFDIAVAKRDGNWPLLLIEAYPGNDYWPWSHRIQQIAARIKAVGHPGLIVSNMNPDSVDVDALERMSHGAWPIHFAMWRGPADDRALSFAIERLLTTDSTA
jgi:hypothetical protein